MELNFFWKEDFLKSNCKSMKFIKVRILNIQIIEIAYLLYNR